MGGKSTGTFTIDTDNHVGVFHGKVEIVSFLNAPGFIKAETTKGETWPDTSNCRGLQLTIRSETPSYTGFRVSFGNKRPPGAFPYSYGFKTDLHLTSNDANKDNDDDDETIQTIHLPFDNFTDKWDAGTGNAITTCAENKEFCPTAADKASLYSIAVWGEGVEGEVDMQLYSIAAYGCTSSTNDTAAAAAATNGNDNDNGILNISSDDSITIEDFSNNQSINKWITMNDPVMGGESFSSISIHDGMASFEGMCAIVPFLKAPGFITMTTGTHFRPDNNNNKQPAIFPDVSACKALKLTLRSRVDYDGYYVSFGTDKVPGGHHAMGYKAPIDIATTSIDASSTSSTSLSFTDITLNFSSFSSHWDDATGKTKITCLEDPSVCPTVETLQNMKTISVWGEGVEGNIALDIKYIGAVGCASGGNDDANDDDTSLISSSSATGTTNSSIMLLGTNTTTNSNSCVWGIATAAIGSILVVLLMRLRHRRYNRSDTYDEVKQVVLDADMA